jgi:hypothetical protein
MEFSTALGYYEAISVIDAENRLMDINIVSFPHSSEKGRKETHKALKKLSEKYREEKGMSSEQLEAFFNKKGLL